MLAVVPRYRRPFNQQTQDPLFVFPNFDSKFLVGTCALELLAAANTATGYEDRLPFCVVLNQQKERIW
jgi:hypothetical protein